MKRRIFAGLFAIIGVLLCGVVLAQTASSTQKKANAVTSCEKVELNVGKRLANFETKKQKHITQYEKTQTRVTALVDKLETEGKDVSTLRVFLVEFDQLISKFGTDYDTYIASLGDTQSYACGKSDGEFRAKLGIARSQLKVVHDDSVAIRTYWAKTLKPAILMLKTEAVTTEGEN